MEGSPKGQFAFAATLRECKSRFWARQLEEAFLNGIAPVRIADRYALENSTGKLERKPNSPSVLIPKRGSSLEPLPISGRKSNRLPSFARTRRKT